MDDSKMYALLCCACSKAIDALDGNDEVLARSVLQEALFAAEEIFIKQDEALSSD